MPQTLYRKYRPRLFSEIIGQKHIVQTLTNAIKNNRVGQAYLFTGPRGTGKTTTARIFAKAVNCLPRKNQVEKKDTEKNFEPCLKCSFCENIDSGRALDIIEIDAASHTGVDNIRELRETTKLPPARLKYKVYIIDEAHMLSTGAWNALLKTLEEPPLHVIFILATTEIHKVPDTIISRCQRFDFARLTLEHIVEKLSAMAEKENILIEKEALEMIAIAAEGGMRDAESLLAQVIALEDKKITAREVKEILGISDFSSAENLARFILEKNTAEALQLVNQLSREGYDLEIFGKSFLNYLRQLLLVSVDNSLASTLALELSREQTQSLVSLAEKHSARAILETINIFLDARQNIRSSFIPQLPLEVAIVKAGGGNIQPIADTDRNETKKLVIEKKADFSPDTEIKPSEHEQDRQEPEAEIKQNEKIKQKTGNVPASVSIDDVRRNWTIFLEEIKPHNHSLSSFLANSQPLEINDNTLAVLVRYGLHKEKINENRNRLTIEEVFDKIFGFPLKIKAVTEEEAKIKIAPETALHEPQKSDRAEKNREKNNSVMDEAMKIMGGRIVEE